VAQPFPLSKAFTISLGVDKYCLSNSTNNPSGWFFTYPIPTRVISAGRAVVVAISNVLPYFPGVRTRAAPCRHSAMLQRSNTTHRGQEN
jgi:hypothetical protein